MLPKGAAAPGGACDDTVTPSGSHHGEVFGLGSSTTERVTGHYEAEDSVLVAAQFAALSLHDSVQSPLNPMPNPSSPSCCDCFCDTVSAGMGAS